MLEILKQRRIWASLFALIALVMPRLNLDVDFTTSVLVNFFESLAQLIAVILPLWSYLKPKR